MTAAGKTRIVVLGGGFAGLESAFLLRSKLGPRADITLVSDREAFLFKPNTIYVPFGLDADRLRIPLGRPTAKREIAFSHTSVRAVDPEHRRVETDAGSLRYDFLVVATGAGMSPQEIPGLAEHAETIWTPAEMVSLGRRLNGAVESARDGVAQTVLFAVPPANKCAGPLYELVLMTETWLRRQGVRDRFRLVWTTCEDSYVQAFGPKLDDVVRAEFARRGIEGRKGVRITGASEGEATYEGGERIEHDLLVAFPPYVAAVRYPELASDERGFLHTTGGARRVAGQERIYAPGDAGDFPVKQAFLAFLQADAVAEDLAARVEGREPAFGFEPVSMCVMEELDTATFAQVPLVETGDAARPVAVRAGADGAYRVGVSPLWRVGKKLLGVYLPLRFRNGLPFHAGAPWAGMELGLRGMSALLARR